MQRPIILFGVPRSGSTWLSQILTVPEEMALVHEPDNERISFPGLVRKAGLPRFPFLTQHDQHAGFADLFSKAVAGNLPDFRSPLHTIGFRLFRYPSSKINEQLGRYGTGMPSVPWGARSYVNLISTRKKPGRTVIKTVHGLLALPFLLEHLDAQPIVLWRDPLSVFSSYLNIDMPDRDRGLDTLPGLMEALGVEAGDIRNQHEWVRSGFQLAMFRKAVELHQQKYPQLLMVEYEHLIEDPFSHISELCEQLAVPYTNQTEEFIRSRMKPGKGYQTFRDPNQLRDVWKKRLTENQINLFLSGYRRIYPDYGAE